MYYVTFKKSKLRISNSLPFILQYLLKSCFFFFEVLFYTKYNTKTVQKCGRRNVKDTNNYHKRPPREINGKTICIKEKSLPAPVIQEDFVQEVAFELGFEGCKEFQ